MIARDCLIGVAELGASLNFDLYQVNEDDS